MAVKSFLTNNLVEEHDMYVEFMKKRHAEITENGDAPTAVLFYKPSLMSEGRTNKGASNQRVYVAICKWHCITLAYDIWYDVVKDYAIDNNATSYKKFVDVPGIAITKFKRRVEKAIEEAKCDYNMRINRGSGSYDACRYLAMFWTYLDCVKDEKTQRFLPSEMTQVRAASIFGYANGDNPFAMNGKFRHIIKNVEDETSDDIFTVPEINVSVLDTMIEDMNLSMKTYNCLKRAGCNTLGDILDFDYKSILKVRNFGLRSLVEVVDKLAEYGKVLDGTTVDPTCGMLCGRSPRFAKLVANKDIRSIVDKILECRKEGLSNAEIAKKLDIPESTVREKLTSSGISWWEDKKENDLVEQKKEVERLTKLCESLRAKLVDHDYLVKEIDRLKARDGVMAYGDLETKYKKLQDAYDKLEASHDAVVMENNRLRKDTNTFTSDPIDLISKAVSGLRDKKIGKITTTIDGYEVDICLKYTVRMREDIV